MTESYSSCSFFNLVFSSSSLLCFLSSSKACACFCFSSSNLKCWITPVFSIQQQWRCVDWTYIWLVWNVWNFNIHYPTTLTNWMMIFTDKHVDIITGLYEYKCKLNTVSKPSKPLSEYLTLAKWSRSVSKAFMCCVNESQVAESNRTNSFIAWSLCMSPRDCHICLPGNRK